MSAPLCTVHSARSVNLEEHTRHLHDWQLEYDQLDCGRFEGEFLDVRLPGMQLFMERTSRRLRQHGLLTADSVGLGLMLAGQGELIVNGVRPGPRGLAVVHDGELEMTSPPDCTLTGVVVDAPLLQQAADELLGRPLDLRRGAVLGLVAAADRFQALLPDLRAGLMPDSSGEEAAQRIEARDRVLVQLVHILGDVRNADARGCAAHRKALVERACRLMLAHAHEPPSLDDVCRSVGASSRKLNYCFQDILGMSPNRYARALRLNEARRELHRCRDANSSVYDIATRWGFWHFGRFSCDYKQQFGESPSQSLKRARLDRPAQASRPDCQ